MLHCPESSLSHSDRERRLEITAIMTRRELASCTKLYSNWSQHGEHSNTVSLLGQGKAM